MSKELIGKIRQYIPNGDGYNSDFANDLSQAAELIESQMKEVKALRWFAKDMFNYELVADGHFKRHGLIDENGKPTKILTG